LNKTNAQTSTYEFNIPASDYKIKIIIKSCIARFAKWSDVDINPCLYFSVSHTLFSGLLKKKMRRRFEIDWERIWKRFGDTQPGINLLKKLQVTED